ncbi:MAG: RluA family pseudouridine synthase [Clostridiales bacterium]|nr:RluA family pseudouridine synthase [Clostridiales bacterium]
MIEFTAPDEAAGKRLDAFAAEASSFSRNSIQRLIENGDLLLNGREAASKTKVRAGDVITIVPPPPAMTDIVPQDIPLDIVYQDDDIAVINKPKGMVVHPAAGNPDGTLVNAIMYHVKDLSGVGGEMRPGIVHRIDRMTSGLLVIAKNDRAHAFLSDQLKTHSVSRVYYALCDGNFREDGGTVDAPIARSRNDRKKMAVDPAGRNAVTHWRVLERFGDVTFLRLELETGRTHQIRVHMSHIKHPIVGDEVYGRARNKLGIVGQALHAGELRLIHPSTGELMTFTAPLPEEFENALAKLRKASMPRF